MSSITVFTVATCPYSKQVKSALEHYNLPYNEISLSEFPQKRKDLLQLTGDKTSVPQVFVHTEWIGGVDETLGWLRIHGNSWQMMKGPDIRSRRCGGGSAGGLGGSSNPRFMVPIMEEDLCLDYTCHDDDDNDDNINNYATATQPISEGLTTATTTQTDNDSSLDNAPTTSSTDTIRISCPDGTFLTVLQMTEKLKQILQYGRRRYNFTTYKNCCTAEEIVDAFVEHYKISRTRAEDFGRLLQRHNFMSHVCDDHQFQDSNAYFFRLQCFQTPGVVNTYRIWPAAALPSSCTTSSETTITTSDPKLVMERLTVLFQRIEEAIIGPDGYINYRVAYMCSDFPAFEDAVCELQRVDLSCLYGAEMVAFALNVYNMMMKYSFMKLGVPASDGCRISFCNQVRFNVAGHVYSLQEWLDGVLRGNRKSPVTKTHAFSSKKDPRMDLASKVGEAYSRDCRIHFAIQCWSRSRRSPPVKTFTGSGLDEELAFVAHAFCEEDDNVAFHCKEKRMRLAPVFRSYKADFLEKNSTIPRAVLQFLYGSRRAKLDGLLGGSRRRTAARALKMSSRAEDWTLGIGDFIPFDTDSIKPNVRRIGKCVRSTTCASSYRPDKSDAVSGLQNACGSEDGSTSFSSSVRGSSPWLPTRENSGGKIKRNKTDSIPKPFSRRYVDGADHQRSSIVDAYDEIDSNVSSTSICSSTISEKLQMLGEPIQMRGITSITSVASVA